MHIIATGDIVVLEKEESTILGFIHEEAELILGWVVNIIGHEIQMLTTDIEDDDRRYYLESHRVVNESKITIAKHHVSNLEQALDILENPDEILSQYKEGE